MFATNMKGIITGKYTFAGRQIRQTDNMKLRLVDMSNHGHQNRPVHRNGLVGPTGNRTLNRSESLKVPDVNRKNKETSDIYF